MKRRWRGSGALDFLLVLVVRNHYHLGGVHVQELEVCPGSRSGSGPG